ncbi:hypothetical protein LCGC14_2005220 [marine sediment metagenome]|uniref:Uncharacterized protein n=1 Tax=marine sediment metagenome TaxID=412755 RepID=A0A0F9F223_9ZZZZ
MKQQAMMMYSEHVEISSDESDVGGIADLIDERIERDIRVTRDVYPYFLWCVFKGTAEQLTGMRKTIRRLSRGKLRFTFVFKGIVDCDET